VRINTVEELRAAYASKTALYHVEYLPFLEFYAERRPCGYGYGRLDDIYTTHAEAVSRVVVLRAEGLIETLELWRTSYPSTGGRARALLDEGVPSVEEAARRTDSG
jgi:hypothetical protein